MIIIIDGYNVLKRFHGVTVSDAQKSAFINLLGRYMKKRNHRILVVFDGGPHFWPLVEKQKGVAVWHSGERQSADDLIIAYAHEHKNKDIVAVTADGEIVKKVGQADVQVIDPSFFYEKVKEVCTSHSVKAPTHYTGIEKLSDEDDEMVDALMFEAAGMKIPCKDHEGQTERHRSLKTTISKKDALYQSKINKL